MSAKMFLLAGAAALALAGCHKKPEAPVTPAAETTLPTTQGIAVGEPNPSTPLPGQNVNTGAPVDGDATVTVPVSVGAGAIAEIGWTGPGNSGDYIDLVPRGSTATSGEITYSYTRDAIPVAKLRAPTAPGDYDVRYVAQLEGGRTVKATAPLTVAAAVATLTAPPKAEAGEPFTVEWVGPAGNGDYVDIVPAGFTQVSGEITYAWTRDGNPAKLVAPSRAGPYQIRYVLEGAGKRTVLVVSALDVTAATATLQAPDSAAKGAKVKVQWTGPKRRGDYVDLVKKGHAATSGELSYFYTDRDGSSELTAPAEAGDYEIRYVLEAPGGRRVLTKRSLTVQ